MDPYDDPIYNGYTSSDNKLFGGAKVCPFENFIGQNLEKGLPP